MTTMRFYCHQSTGELLPEHAALIADFMRQNFGKQVQAVFRTGAGRSLSQNSYYWAVVLPVVCNMLRGGGVEVTPDDAHEYLKRRFLPDDFGVVAPDGRVVFVHKSTANLTKPEFADFLNAVIAWASDYGVSIPSPTKELKE